MQRDRRYKVLLVMLVLALTTALAGLVALYPSATRTLFEPRHQQLIDRAEQAAAKTFRHSIEDQRRITFPMVMEMSDRTCVELRSHVADGGGNYLACYSKSGAVLEERASSGF